MNHHDIVVLETSLYDAMRYQWQSRNTTKH